MNLQTILRASQCLPGERRRLLDSAITQLRAHRAQGPLHLVSVCTHNSRRSQLCQAWLAAAIAHYALSDIDSHSCGTAVTACNPRTIATLQRAGWHSSIDRPQANNPRYSCTLSSLGCCVQLWSKAFGDSSLPQERIIALMCCDDADHSCPVVPGALVRLALHYVDPKVSDDGPDEVATYDARSLQIASEMFYLMGELKAADACPPNSDSIDPNFR